MKGRILKFNSISLMQQKVVYNEVILPGVSLLLGSYIFHFLSQEREHAEVYCYPTVISHLIGLFLLDLFNVNFILLIKIDGGEDKEDPVVRMLHYFISIDFLFCMLFSTIHLNSYFILHVFYLN